MKKALFGLLIISLMTTHGIHASCGKDSKTQQERFEIPEKMLYDQDPAEWLKFFTDNPQYINRKLFIRGNQHSSDHEENLLLWVINLDRLGYDFSDVINFFITKKINIQDAPYRLLNWAYDRYEKRRCSSVSLLLIIDLMLEQEIDPQHILEKLKDYNGKISNDSACRAFLSDVERSKKKLEDIIIKFTIEQIQDKTFPDIAKLLKPSDPRILAIKHAIEDENLDVLARALDMTTLFGEVDKELLELRDQTGYTPFLYAAYLGKRKAMRMLIEVGADVNAQTIDGAKATDFGDYAKLIDEARLYREGVLAENKKNEKQYLKENSESLFHAIENNLPDQITMFTTPEIINMKNNQGNTPLSEAASSGNTAAVKALLNKNPDTSLTNGNRNTALQSAIIEGHFDIANLLVELMDKKALQNKNEQGFTAQDLAKSQEDRNKDNAEFHAFMKTLEAKLDDK